MTARPRGPTGTIAKLYAEALRDVDRNQAIIDMLSAEITAIKKQGCPWCRMMRAIKGGTNGKPV
jgi:hypothetical protein